MPASWHRHGPGSVGGETRADLGMSRCCALYCWLAGFDLFQRHRLCVVVLYLGSESRPRPQAAAR